MKFTGNLLTFMEKVQMNDFNVHYRRLNGEKKNVFHEELLGRDLSKQAHEKNC